MKPLDAVRLNLDGKYVVEASAGSGKTHAITTLYIRLLVEKSLSVHEILVLTYTRAATAELRSRLLRRLHSMINALEGDQDDSELAAIADRLAATEKPAALERLKSATSRFDEAAVFTIHGFCQRVLGEHALLASVPFSLELKTDFSQELRSLANDFSARSLQHLDGVVARSLQDRGVRPTELARLAIKLQSPKVAAVPSGEEIDLGDELKSFESARSYAATLWNASKDELVQLLCDHPSLNRRSYNPITIRKTWARSLDGMFTRNLLSLPQFFERLTYEGMALKKDKDPPEHAFFSACGSLAKAFDLLNLALDRYAIQLRLLFVESASDYIRSELQVRGRVSYDELLYATFRALLSKNTGSLRTALRSQYKAALIDEFQDTDPVQHEIVSSIFGDTDCPLFLIGDPKQAIYSFRGADVFSYINASSDPQFSRATLHNNWRSTNTLVDATNSLFSGRSNAFVLPQIAFEKAVARSEKQTDGAGFEVLWLDDNGATLTKSEFQEKAVSATVAEISYALSAYSDPVLAKSRFAVLCRTNAQATKIHRALSDANITASLDGDASVFDSDAARELHWVMESTIDSTNEDKLRRALSTSIMGDGLSTVALANSDPEVFAKHEACIEIWSTVWQTKSFAEFFQQLIFDTQVQRRLAESRNGSRHLTDLIHLSELLSRTESQEHLTPLELCERFRALRLNHDRDETFDHQEIQLRPDREDAAVVVTTVHKSKGLEFPHVFVPFLGGVPKLRRTNEQMVAFHDPESSHTLTVDLGSTSIAQSKSLALQEEQSEAIRLLYVAFTRAKERCTIVWANVKDADKTSFGFLIGCETNPHEALEALATRSEGSIVIRPPVDFDPVITQPSVDSLGNARDTQRTELHTKTMSSFSSMVEHTDKEIEPPDEKTLHLETTLRDFPRGAEAGNALHRIFESLMLGDPTAVTRKPMIAEVLTDYGFDPEWVGKVDSDLERILSTPLIEGSDISLGSLEWSVSEMEFTLASNPRNDSVVPPNDFMPVDGFIRGFIDLVFKHKGRWYVLDYKSNVLGNSYADYEAASLTSVVKHNRYDMQAQLYTLALHRHLRTRLPEYSYEQHFGGSLVAFLRGMHGATKAQSGVHFARMSEAELEELNQAYLA